jgi:hypothetical protein
MQLHGDTPSSAGAPAHHDRNAGELRYAGGGGGGGGGMMVGEQFSMGTIDLALHHMGRRRGSGSGRGPATASSSPPPPSSSDDGTARGLTNAEAGAPAEDAQPPPPPRQPQRPDRTAAAAAAAVAAAGGAARGRCRARPGTAGSSSGGSLSERGGAHNTERLHRGRTALSNINPALRNVRRRPWSAASGINSSGPRGGKAPHGVTGGGGRGAASRAHRAAAYTQLASTGKQLLAHGDVVPPPGGTAGRGGWASRTLGVRRPWRPFWRTLTEIYLCGVCSCQKY